MGTEFLVGTGVSYVTLGDRLPAMSPEWVPVEMEQDGAPPARLHGNYEGGFAMAAVGAGYHDVRRRDRGRPRLACR